jgi:hypothetical protein
MSERWVCFKPCGNNILNSRFLKTSLVWLHKLGLILEERVSFVIVLPSKKHYWIWKENLNLRVGITLTGLTPPQICACSKSELGFLMSYVVVLFMSHDLMWEVIDRFVDIGRIADHNGWPQHMTLEIQVLTWNMHIFVAGLNRLMWSQPLHVYYDIITF